MSSSALAIVILASSLTYMILDGLFDFGLARSLQRLAAGGTGRLRRRRRRPRCRRRGCECRTRRLRPLTRVKLQSLVDESLPDDRYGPLIDFYEGER
ncbi:hypothetical protein [Nonomuraea soli]|uniref:Uncharacterized protein n=1 Tax=Nonomuraea soli TaxID=1032476 RepID=A0A7W0HVS5_9ACTN|nr:hypothetical protein [Nonomuraea soli]MBA2897367.1 hypothetical protein [Nonomuraea soli]